MKKGIPVRYRLSLVVVLFVIAVADLCAQNPTAVQNLQSPENTKPPFTITISTPASSIRAGSEVDLNVVTQNISDRVLYRLETSADAFFGRNLQIDLRDGKGIWVLETPYGRERHGTDPNRPRFEGSVVSIRTPLKPGETFEEKIVLSREYDLSKPDIYTVHALRSDMLSETNINFSKVTAGKSNTITLTVIP
jgi:hypothetical protein